MLCLDELALLDREACSEQLHEWTRLICQGDCKKIFIDPIFQNLIRTPKSDCAKNWESAIDLLKDQSNDFRNSLLPIDVLAAGIALLEAFIQTNFCGPYLDLDITLLVPQSLGNVTKPETADAKQIWSLELHEEAYERIPRAWLLVLSQCILKSKHLLQLKSSSLWRARVNFMVQRMLDDFSVILYDEIMKDLQDFLVVTTKMGSQRLKSICRLEMALVTAYYQRDDLSLGFAHEAARIADLEWVLTGKLGRKTKFQDFDTSLLVVLAQPGHYDKNTETKALVPDELPLNDDTLLENIVFTKEQIKIEENDVEIPNNLLNLDPDNQPKLQPLMGCILLGLAHCIHNTNPNDGITMEQMAPFCARVLQHPLNWMIHTSALLLKAKLESTNARKLERSILQLQVLIDQLLDEMDIDAFRTVGMQNQQNIVAKRSALTLETQVDSAPFNERIKWFYQLLIPPKWNLESELAYKYFSIGSTKSAIEIFERLGLYIDVAVCWARLSEPEKAVKIIRKQLDVNPNSPKLWTMLGELENNPDYFEKAWDVSDGHYAKAQRLLGKNYLKQNDYMKAKDAFHLSICVNPVNHSAWYSLGFCEMQLENWNNAQEAYSRCVKIESEDAESWNNLALCMLRANPPNLQTAWNSLQQAARLSYENWKIWENYMLISAKVEEWGHVCRALGRLIKISSISDGEKSIRFDMLSQLFEKIKKGNLKDQKYLEKQFLDLFTNEIVPLITDNSQLWDLASAIYVWKSDYSNALSAHGKAYRCVKSNHAAKGQQESWNLFAKSAIKYADSLKLYGQMIDESSNEPYVKDWKFKSNSILKSAINSGLDINLDSTEEFMSLKQRLEV